MANVRILEISYMCQDARATKQVGVEKIRTITSASSWGFHFHESLHKSGEVGM